MARGLPLIQWFDKSLTEDQLVCHYTLDREDGVLRNYAKPLGAPFQLEAVYGGWESITESRWTRTLSGWRRLAVLGTGDAGSRYITLRVADDAVSMIALYRINEDNKIEIVAQVRAGEAYSGLVETYQHGHAYNIWLDSTEFRGDVEFTVQDAEGWGKLEGLSEGAVQRYEKIEYDLVSKGSVLLDQDNKLVSANNVYDLAVWQHNSCQITDDSGYYRVTYSGGSWGALRQYFTVEADTVMTLVADYKAGSHGKVRHNLWTGSRDVAVEVDLTSGEVLSVDSQALEYRVTALGDGGYRVYITGNVLGNSNSQAQPARTTSDVVFDGTDSVLVRNISLIAGRIEDISIEIPASPLYKLRRTVEDLLTYRRGQSRSFLWADASYYAEFPVWEGLEDFEVSFKMQQPLGDQALWGEELAFKIVRNSDYELRALNGSGHHWITSMTALNNPDSSEPVHIKVSRIADLLTLEWWYVTAPSDIYYTSAATSGGVTSITARVLHALYGSHFANGRIWDVQMLDLTNPANSRLYLLDGPNSIQNVLTDKGDEMLGDIESTQILAGDTENLTTTSFTAIENSTIVRFKWPVGTFVEGEFYDVVIRCNGAFQRDLCDDNDGITYQAGTHYFNLERKPRTTDQYRFIDLTVVNTGDTIELLSVRHTPNAGQYVNANDDDFTLLTYQGDATGEWLGEELAESSTTEELVSIHNTYWYTNAAHVQSGKTYRIRATLQADSTDAHFGWSSTTDTGYAVGISSDPPFLQWNNSSDTVGGDFVAETSGYIKLFRSNESSKFVDITVLEVLKDA
ncbi:MAG: hypothetical protein ACPGPF_00015 [Pontibacterium sp.]